MSTRRTPKEVAAKGKRSRKRTDRAIAVQPASAVSDPTDGAQQVGDALVTAIRQWERDAVTAAEAAGKVQVEESITQPELLRTTARELPCVLTADEKARFSSELVATIEKAEQEEIEQDEHKKEMKTILAGYRASQSKLARILSKGIESRPVEVCISAHYDIGKVRTVRTDTGEIVEERPLTDAERQPSLLPGLAKGADAAGVVHSEAAETERKG